jgi:hypothetical protein
MEKEGVVGAADHAGKREILVGEDAALSGAAGNAHTGRDATRRATGGSG